MAVAVQVGPADGPDAQLLRLLPGQDDLSGLRAVDLLGAHGQGLGGEGAGAQDLSRHRVHQNPVAADGGAQPSLLVRHLVYPLHVGALDAVFPGGDVQHLPGPGAAVDLHRHPGEEKGLPHLQQLFVGQAPGVVVIAGVVGRLAQKGGDPGVLVSVTVGKGQLLLAEIAVFRQLGLKRIHGVSDFLFSLVYGI